MLGADSPATVDLLPAVRGVIERRILVNYSVDTAPLDAALPDRFRPVTVDGRGVGGICLIRLADVRPRGLPALVGHDSENAAHRIAVEWDENADGAGVEGRADGGADGESDGARRGVYIPRRDSSSRLNGLLGGRLFPGWHYAATFDVAESGDDYRVEMRSEDGETRVLVDGTVADAVPDASVFDSLADASAFFQAGSLGYSPMPGEDGTYEGVELYTHEWRMEPLDVREVASSYFEGRSRFPADAVDFDSAFLMRNIDHEWRGRESLCAAVD